MSDFSLTLVLHFKTSKNFNDIAKVSIKSEKITPFGVIFHVREHFLILFCPQLFEEVEDMDTFHITYATIKWVETDD